MLKSLFVKNFVLIDEITIDFSPHLTTITGETGAGKSILLGALNLILGHRADSSTVADESKTTVIEGTFDLTAYQLQAIFEAEDLEYRDETVLRREIRANGKSRAFVNDNLVNLHTLKTLADYVIDIHEQFDSHFLRNRHFRFQVLDSLAGQSQDVYAFQTTFHTWKQRRAELKKLEEKRRELIQKKDFIEFQLNEIVQLKYQPGEFAELDEQLNLVKNATDISEIIQMANHMFDGPGNNILDQFRSLMARLAHLQIEMKPLQSLKERLETNFIELEDLYSDFSQLEDLVELDPGKAERIEARMADIFKLVKKHNLTGAEDLIQLRHDLENELGEIEETDHLNVEFSREIERLEKELNHHANQLSTRRKEQITNIRKAVLDHLALLNLDKAEFQISIMPSENIHEYGRDEIQFLFSANPGVALAPVEKVASGGEISRLALAVKALIARTIPLPTIVFDEIDAGVSGSAADKMGSLLHNLGRQHQVICITHSPQVAARADKHLFVYKEILAGHSITQIRELKTEERVTQLAIMMSTDPPSASAMENAKYLLEKS